MEQEIWKDVVGYEGRYQVSSHGRIRRLKKYGNGDQIMRTGGSLYKMVRLTNKNKIKKAHTIHRLVMTAFVPNPENKKTINHKDANKLNNHLSNLEWATYSENVSHAFNMGLYIPKHYKLTKEILDKMHQLKSEGKSISEISLATGYSKSRTAALLRNEHLKTYNLTILKSKG